ncbi:hypothetical protein H0A36_17230 [Endozoicomonas sp. SM1973]|uniref:Uncharacterized protein n=1 Tax=Spartinivicinus marinus TaxID=2994442 RepID=A0A853I4Z7_9GAMM|nr:hypothetical protein [Spartinivicinus marinus]MCX4029139.1 hypothetical protein [Spartinivicinus marinus]NYZ67759.1 hypothetical protein [Spartinivicinus marinus]
MDITNLEKRLSLSVPPEYSEILYSGKMPTGFDVKTLCVLNLELWSNLNESEIKNRFFLSGDGCGNYYFVETNRDAEVFLLSHDPVGIEKTGMVLDQFLKNAVQECPIMQDLEQGELAICRTDIPGESILNPIMLDEWLQAIENVQGINHLGYREGKNPFTGEVHRFDIPGYAVAETSEYSLCLGRVLTMESIGNNELAFKLAEELEANLIKGKS